MSKSFFGNFLLANNLLGDVQSVNDNFKISSVISLLKTAPQTRPEKSIHILKLLTKNIDFIKNHIIPLGDSVHSLVCQCLEYRYYDKDEFVIKRGEQGTKFYIILNGTVSVMIDPEDFKDPSKASVLTSGMAFGELALLKSQPRMASIKCNTPCHFMILCKEDFLHILGKNESKKYEEYIEFLRSLSIFSSWSKKAVEKISYSFKKKLFHRNQIVYKENDSPDFMYIVESGEFEFSKNCAELVKNDEIFINKTNKEKFHSKKKIVSRCALIGKGEIFGDEEIIKEIPRVFTCKCVSQGALLMISNHDFFHKIRSEESIQYLSECNSIKKELRNSRISIARNIMNNFPKNETTSKKNEFSQKSIGKKNEVFQTFINKKKIEKAKKKRIKPLTSKEIKRIQKLSQGQLTPTKLSSLGLRLKSFSPHPNSSNISILDPESKWESKPRTPICLTPVERYKRYEF